METETDILVHLNYINLLLVVLFKCSGEILAGIKQCLTSVR